MPPRYYPLYVRLQGRFCLVVGGGSVGERKVKTLLASGAEIGLIATERTLWLEQACGEGRLRFLGMEYGEMSLEGVDLVFAATSDPALNRRIAEDARRRGVWCNMASDPEEGSFIVPATFERGALTIAISTSGMSPALARQIRKKLEEDFGPEWSLFLQFMGLLRKKLQAGGLSSEENQRLFRALAALPLPEWIKAQAQGEALDAVEKITHPRLTRPELIDIWNRALSRAEDAPTAD